MTAAVNSQNLKITIPLSVFWICGPLVAFWLSQPLTVKKPVCTKEEEWELRMLAGQIWDYFEAVTGPQDNWLPPDNLQEDPPRGLARRTSPTNIGLLIVSTVAARDFGFLTTMEMLERIEKTVTTGGIAPEMAWTSVQLVQHLGFKSAAAVLHICCGQR
jgi:hypothetical protein